MTDVRGVTSGRSWSEGPAAAMGWGLLLTTLLVHAAFVATYSLDRGKARDFLPMYLGTRIAQAGESPYRKGATDAAYRSFPGGGFGKSPTEDLQYPVEMKVDNFYYPPQVLLLIAPLARLPWEAARGAWTAFLTLLAVGCGSLAWTFGPPARRSTLAAGVLVALILLNPLTQLSISLGQTALILCGGVALGEWAFERGWRVRGVLAWSLVGVKPHLAVPFLVLAWALGGWRRFRDVVLVIAVANVLGCLVTTGTLATLWEYPRFLQATALDLEFNRPTSDHLVSWNRLVYVLAGIPVELTIATILASYAGWWLLLGLRSAWGRGARLRWTPAYWLATVAAAALLWARSHGYDMVMMLLLAPYMHWLWVERRRADVAFLATLMIVAMVPRNVMVSVTDRMHLTNPWLDLVLSYRAWATAALGVYLLAAGPPRIIESGGGSGAGLMSKGSG